MTRRTVAAVLVAVAACDGGGGEEDRVGVAKAAITIEPNEVSCSSPAKRAFSAGLCVCEDVTLVGSGLTVISEEKQPVDVGVNGKSRVVGEWKISGTLASWSGVEDVGELVVSGDVVTPASVTGVGSLEVGNDLVVGGDLSTVGQVKVGGVLRAGGKVTAIGSTGGATRGTYTAPAAPPCGCDDLIDVAAEVESARVTNDNASIGLEVKPRSVGELTLELKGGRYFVEGSSTVGSLKLHVTRPSALYLKGDLVTVGTDSIEVDEGASLDLYIDGSIENVGTWNVGAGTLAGVVRLFISGGGSGISMVGEKDFVGSIYAPQADITLVGDTSIRGALFAKKLTGTGRLLVDHAKPAEPPGDACAR